MKFIYISIAWVVIASLVHFYVNKQANPQEPQSPDRRYSIGLLIMATGKYVDFVGPLIKSADTFFCKNHKVTYFVFTDGQLPHHDNVVKIYQPQLGWPYDSMMRFGTYYKHRARLQDCDYLFSCDADMRFAACVGDEILGDRVATIHSGCLFAKGPYETNPISTACIAQGEGVYYFAGAFYGGKRDEFLKLARTAKRNVNIDLARGVIARVNDESHLNRYFVDNEPTVMLSPSYCHFSHWDSPYPKKLLAIDDKVPGMRKQTIVNPAKYYRHYLGQKLHNTSNERVLT